MYILEHCMAAMAVLLALSLAMTARAELPDLTPLIEQASSAVMDISTQQKLLDRAMARGQPSIPGFKGLPSMFRDFLKRSAPQVLRNPCGQQHEVQSLGFGFAISDDGCTLTSNHVVADVDGILVRLFGCNKHKAKLIGVDPRSNMAVSKVGAKNLPTLELGDSNKLKMGEWTLIIDSSFGSNHPVTAGIVGARGCSLPSESYASFIQTDVVTDPGNSGDPSLDLKDEVVGINSQTSICSGGFVSLSFATPINIALNVADQLKEVDRVSRGQLGVVIQEVSKDLAESLGLDRPSGALVTQLVEGSPAAKGGLQVGDVALSLNGQSANRSADLPHLVGSMKPGDKINLDVIRDDQCKPLSMAADSLLDDDEEIASMGAPDAEHSSDCLGVTATSLTAEQRRSLGIQGGVMIKEVQDDSAAVIGLRPGDVITHLNSKAVTLTKAFVDVAEALSKNRSVSIRVLCQGRASFITLKLVR